MPAQPSSTRPASSTAPTSPAIGAGGVTGPSGRQGPRLTAARARFDAWTRPAVVIVLVVSVFLRIYAHTPLWLDEAQTVDIAHRSIPHMFSALRKDGSPPLYYVLLHYWMVVFGTSDYAVRSLSSVCSIASLPLIAVAARRFGLAPHSSWPAVLLLATSPFAVRYSTETRMYSLVVLLVLLAMLAYERLWTVGGRWPAVAAAALTGALVLTQYWALFALAATGLAAIWLAWRGERRARRLLVPMVIGGLCFVPWLPAFAYQSAHTGAPWGGPPSVDTPFLTYFDWTGAEFSSPWLALAYFLFAALAIAGVAQATGGIAFTRPVRRGPLLLLVLGVATLLVGTLASEAVSSAYAPRYSFISFAPLLLVVASGFGALPAGARSVALAVVCALGLVASVPTPFQLRSQAAQVAHVLKAAGPDDLVVFCPDQLGPAVARLAPNAGRQVVYPTFGSPGLVDWVDYAKRNKNSHPVAFANRAIQMAQGHPIWLIYEQGYRTFGNTCLQLLTSLSTSRGQPAIELKATSRSFEREAVFRFRAAPSAGG